MKKISDNLYQLLDILNDHQYHDGDSIGKQLGITRAAVWKMIKKLEKYGIQIDSIKGRGYIMHEPLILLDAKKISQSIPIEVFEEIDSTNHYLKSKRDHQLQFCFAEQQTAGRGRLNREWYSPFGKNIYMSCLYPIRKDISELAGLSLVAGLAILRVLQNYMADKKLTVKWPNDILHHKQKLAGILIDVQAETHGLCDAVIGIGINVNMRSSALYTPSPHSLSLSSPRKRGSHEKLRDSHFRGNDKRSEDDAETISQPWTSLRNITHQYIDRNQLSAALIQQLLTMLKQFEQQGFQAFTQEWQENDCLMLQTIALKNADQLIQGKMLGVTEQGHLLLQLNDNTTRAFSSGEASVVK